MCAIFKIAEYLDIAVEELVACGVTTFSSTMLSPTHMQITGEGAFQIGMAAGHYDARLEKLREAMNAMVPTEIKTPILPYMFSKLVVNSGITCGGALTGQLLGQMLKASEARKFFISLVYEDMALAEKMGVSRQTINAIEKGDYNPTIKLCTAICKALGKTLDELFWE